MDLKNQNILFFTRAMALGGTENVILQMCEILKSHVNKIVVCSCGGLNVEKLEKMGIKHYTIPDIDRKSPILMYKVYNRIKKIIKAENISIVHTHHRMATFYMRFLRKKYNFKLISTLHGSFSDKRFLTRMTYKNIDIIACGKTAKEFFVKNYKIDEKRITVINNAIIKETNKNFSIDLNQYVKESQKKISYIGRLSKEKGVNILIDAMPTIIKNNKDVCLFIVGEGYLEDELKNQVAKLGIESNVIFLGYQDKIQEIIQQIDLVVLPSFTEGLPLTPIEAFAHSKPVVATSAGGTVEIVEDNINGFLVPVGDADALAEKINEILQNKKLYDQMCVEAKKSFDTKYDYEVFKNKIIDYYKKIVEGK